MFIDTHCHIFKEYYENIDEIVNEMKNNIIIVSGDSNKSNHEVIKLIEKYPNVYGTIGIHPDNASTYNEEDIRYIEENMDNPKIVGIGEIGLDYYHNKDNKSVQIELFEKQIALAQQYHKTIVIHSRDAINDTYEILIKNKIENEKAILHCYSSSLEMAKKFTQLGVKLGIGGVLTFKNEQVLKNVVENIDLKYLLLETDSPFLSPEPYRGKKNRPINCYLVAQKISEIKKISVEEVLKTTTNNAIYQFDLKI